MTIRGRINSVVAILILLFSSSSHGYSAEASALNLNIGSSRNFAMLAGTAITFADAASISGDASLKTGMSPELATAGLITSILAGGSSGFENNSTSAQVAQSDLDAALDSLDTFVVSTNKAVFLNETLLPGYYGTLSDAALAVGGTITLDGAGNPHSVFIIRTGSALGFSAATQTVLVNGAQAANVYWIAGSAITLGAASTVDGNIISRTATTIMADSVIHGAVLTQGALTIEARVSLSHDALIPPVGPPSKPTPTATPTSTATPTPTATPTLLPVIESPTPQPTVSEQTRGDSSPSVTSGNAAIEYSTYKPVDHPISTANTIIGAFATLGLITASGLSLGNDKSQGYLAKVGPGGALIAANRSGRGDRRRSRKSITSGKFINFFSAFATRISANSPLAARAVSDANYLRAAVGNYSLLTILLAFGLGTAAAFDSQFEALPPSIIIVIALMALGIYDAMAGFVAVTVFSIVVISSGNVHSLQDFLTLAGIMLIGFSPGILAGVFRPLRRVTDTSAARWDRVTDYALASILTGWVVKQIAAGMPGLSGLQLPIADHAIELGLTAGLLVLIRFALEDTVNHVFPSRLHELEPAYRDRTHRNTLAGSVVQIAAFALIAQPFIGWRIELWIGLAIFALPLFLERFSTNFPKSAFLGRWLPTGITEMLLMTTVGILLARMLHANIDSPSAYILASFVILSIPGLILTVLPMFGSNYVSTWRSAPGGETTYRILGLISLGALVYVVFSGLLVSNAL